MSNYNCACVNQGFLSNQPWDKCDICNGTGIKGAERKHEAITDLNGELKLIFPNKFTSELPKEVFNKYLEQQRKPCVVIPNSMIFVPLEEVPTPTANRIHFVCESWDNYYNAFCRLLNYKMSHSMWDIKFHDANKHDPLTTLRGCVGDVVFDFDPDPKLLDFAKVVTRGVHKIYRLEDNYHLSQADLC